MAIEDPWSALSIDEVATVLDGLPVRWWIAGGQAIDLFVGSSTRHHQDVVMASSIGLDSVVEGRRRQPNSTR